MRKLSAFVIAAAIATPAVAAPNIVANGGFEAPPIGNSYVQYDAPNDGISNWNVTDGSVDLVDASYKPFAGNQALDLVGVSQGTISQLLTTIAQQRYQLTFRYSNNPDSSSSFLYEGLASVGAASTGFSHTGANRSNMNWQLGTLNFVGTGSDLLTFKATSDSGNGGIFLDAVSVLAVPEPATWAMTILGIGLVGGALRRRRQPQLRTA